MRKAYGNFVGSLNGAIYKASNGGMRAYYSIESRNIYIMVIILFRGKPSGIYVMMCVRASENETFGQ